METDFRKATMPSYQIADPIARAERWIEEQKEKQALAFENKQMKPKAEYFDELVERKMLSNFRDTARELVSIWCCKGKVSPTLAASFVCYFFTWIVLNISTR